MTNRAEFQPERPALPVHYLELIEAAERVIRHRCTGCAVLAPVSCNTNCAFGSLRITLGKIKDENNRTADGRG